MLSFPQKPLFSKKIVFSCLIDIENRKITVFAKFPNFPDWSNFPKISDCGLFLSQNFRSENIINFASATLYLYHYCKYQGSTSFSPRDVTNFGSS